MWKWILETLLGVESADMARGDSWRLGFADYGPYTSYVHFGLIVLYGLLVALVIATYRREGQAPRAAKGVLAALRIGVLTLLLLVALGPAVVWRFTKTLYRPVVVLIDDSKSMSFTDRYAEQEQTRDRLSQLTGLEESGLVQASRIDLTRRCLLRPEGPLAALAKDHPLVFMKFSTTQPGRETYTRLLGEVNVVDVEEPDARREKLLAQAEEIFATLDAGGFETNLPAALRASVEHSRGRNLAGIVIVSDGQNTTADAARRRQGALAYADQVGFQRYTVLAGSVTPPKNVAVASVGFASEQVRQESDVEVSVVLTHRNMGGMPVKLRLFRREDGAPADRDEPVSFRTAEGGMDTVAGVVLERPEDGDGDGLTPTIAPGEADKGVQTVTLHIEPETQGRFIYTARVESGIPEQNARDNDAQATLSVTDSKIRVLLVAGYAGWEFQYIRNILLRQPDLYRVSIWQQNADPEISQAASTGMKLDALPEDMRDLVGTPEKTPDDDDYAPGYDVVILLDPRPEEPGFSPSFVEMLQTWVRDHSGGLCYMAGTKWTEDLLGDDLFRPLRTLLPVSVGQSTTEMIEVIRGRRPEAWPVQPTSYGLEHPVMRVRESVEESGKIWSIMPGIYWSKAIHDLKPAARILAVNSNPTRRTGSNEPEPILATQPYGHGRVLFVGTHGTWRWRFIEDGYYHRRFWTNVIRYLATLKARRVVITTGGDRFSAGSRITIDVEAYDENYQRLETPDGTFAVQKVDTATGEAEEITARSVEGQPGVYRAEVVASETGTFEFTAMRDQPNAAELVSSKRVVVELPKAEAARTEANARTLLTLASRDENALTLDEVDRLGTLIKSGRMTATEEKPDKLWDSYLMLILVVLLLTTEWIVRKKYNMA